MSTGEQAATDVEGQTSTMTIARTSEAMAARTKTMALYSMLSDAQTTNDGWME